MTGLLSLGGRVLGAAALLVLWLNVEWQMHGALVAGLGPRVLAARFLLCYVAVYWLRLAWRGLSARRTAPPLSGS